MRPACDVRTGRAPARCPAASRPATTGIDKLTGSSRRLDMGRHVVGAFGDMGQPAHRRIVARRHQPAEEPLQIGLHVGIGILLDQQRARGMAHHQHQQAIALPAQPAGNLPGELVEPGAGGVESRSCAASAAACPRSPHAHKIVNGCPGALLLSSWRIPATGGHDEPDDREGLRPGAAGSLRLSMPMAGSPSANFSTGPANGRSAG